jgi:hypothetical protein
LISGLKVTIHSQISSEEAWKLATLENILSDTAILLHDRGVTPQNELEIQAVMHDYLKACFPDFVSDPKIHGSLKAFKPDCGLQSVGAAVEFKIVRDLTQAKVAIGGLAEDASGYRKSREWTRFYALIYQTGPFIPESKLNYEMTRFGATTWKWRVVTAFHQGSLMLYERHIVNAADGGRRVLHLEAWLRDAGLLLRADSGFRSARIWGITP